MNHKINNSLLIDKLTQEAEFEVIFTRFKPIIFKTKRELYIPSWTLDDYFQEGMILLAQLLQKERDLATLPTKFKVKYRQRLIDELRHRRAQKRGFDQLGSLDIYECSDYVSSSSLNPEDSLVFNELLSEVYARLRPHYQALLVRQMQGEELTRMERYRLKEQIKHILFDFE